MNIWNLVNDLYEFVINLYESFETLWNSTFNVGTYEISFKSILTTSLLLIVGLILAKKLLPLS